MIVGMKWVERLSPEVHFWVEVVAEFIFGVLKKKAACMSMKLSEDGICCVMSKCPC
jgi:hypothetical protein